MKKLSAVILILFLAGCSVFESEPSIYAQDSFQKLPWAKHSFDEMMARCRHTSLHGNQKYQHYEVQRPVYKACMEHYGYRYKGHREVADNDEPSYSRKQGMDALIYGEHKSPVKEEDINWNKTPAEIDADLSDSADKTETIKQDKSALYR
jgi:hypothetical protein